jgi:hypothetical protein
MQSSLNLALSHPLSLSLSLFCSDICNMAVSRNIIRTITEVGPTVHKLYVRHLAVLCDNIKT